VHLAHGVPFDRAVFLRSVGHADYAFDPWHGFSPHADRAALELERRARKDERIRRQSVLPGVVALLDAARERGLLVGLASNSEHAWVEPHLARLGLLERFAFLACRDDVASPKPEPDLYRLVLNHLGLRGHEAIAFEDSHTGSLAAKRAGLWTVAAPNVSTAHHDFRHADLQVTSLAQFTLAELITQFGA
jgi:HAD superfamily hydrolase (TIGR01509 family)